MQAFLAALDLIWALFWRQFLPRNRRDGLRLMWIFLEPIGQTAVLMVVFTLIGRTPMVGDSFAMFLLSGIVVLTTFSSGCQAVMGAVAAAGAPSRLPALGLFHEAIARLLFEFFVVAIYFSVLLWGIGVIDRVPTAPAHPLRMVAAFALLFCMSFGVGALRAYAARFAPGVERLYTILSRGLIFVSGIFYVPSFMAPQLRDFLAWNPILQAVELMRLGLYPDYPTIVFSADYLIAFALGTAALGCGLLWRQRAVLLG